VPPDGLGYMLDFGSLDQLIGLPDQHAYADVFGRGPGSLVHVAMGVGSALLPSHWQVLSGSAFFAYETARYAAGKPAWEFAGALVEFSIGVLIGILLGGLK
jgi:hypothetical protein